MSFLDKYRKQKIEKIDCIVTSVSIEKVQKAFVDQYGINLSLVTRDALDSLIKTEMKGAKNDKAKK